MAAKAWPKLSNFFVSVENIIFENCNQLLLFFFFFIHWNGAPHSEIREIGEVKAGKQSQFNA
jgi:hypothetical protein